MWIATRFGGVTSNGFQLDGAPGLLAIVLWCATAFLYYWVFEGLFGTTLGKLVMNLRVRTVAGNRIGLGKALIRNLLRVVDGIGVYLVGFVFALTSRSRQRLGDRVAGTVVVQADAPNSTRLIAVAAWAATMACALVVAVVLHAGAPVSATVLPQITRAVLGTGSADDGSVTGISDTFPASTQQFYLAWQDAGVASDVAVKAVWTVVNADGVAPNTELGEKELSGSDSGSFTLSAPSTGMWPAGQYRVDLYLGGTLAKSLPFTVTKS
jgi:uncharacterized RDD family membrane protein YckC